MKQKNKNGFTIVELLIVIVVIGVLAALVLNSLSQAQQRAKIASARNDMSLLRKTILIARENSGGKTLMQVSGSNCTGCFDQARYELSLDNIGAAANVNLSSLKKGDPWGNKYYIDENEGESVANPCVKDGVGVSGQSTPINADIPFIRQDCI